MKHLAGRLKEVAMESPMAFVATVYGWARRTYSCLPGREQVTRQAARGHCIEEMALEGVAAIVGASTRRSSVSSWILRPAPRAAQARRRSPGPGQSPGAGTPATESETPIDRRTAHPVENHERLDGFLRRFRHFALRLFCRDVRLHRSRQGQGRAGVGVGAGGVGARADQRRDPECVGSRPP